MINPLQLRFYCPCCHIEQIIYVEVEEFYDYINGVSVQEAFPNLDPTHREQIISHLCPKCQLDFFD